MAKTPVSNLQGFPALYFLESVHENRGEKHLIERMWGLHGKYSWLLSYLPSRYENTEKLRKEYLEIIQPRLEDLKQEVDAMFESYNGIFEGMACSDEEKNFLRIMRGVRERADTLAAITRMIDKGSLDEEEFIV